MRRRRLSGVQRWNGTAESLKATPATASSTPSTATARTRGGSPGSPSAAAIRSKCAEPVAASQQCGAEQEQPERRERGEEEGDGALRPLRVAPERHQADGGSVAGLERDDERGEVACGGQGHGRAGDRGEEQHVVRRPVGARPRPVEGEQEADDGGAERPPPAARASSGDTAYEQARRQAAAGHARRATGRRRRRRAGDHRGPATSSPTSASTSCSRARRPRAHGVREQDEQQRRQAGCGDGRDGERVDGLHARSGAVTRPPPRCTDEQARGRAGDVQQQPRQHAQHGDGGDERPVTASSCGVVAGER